MKNWKTLRRVICTGKRLVVFLHDNPDPDALASGWILQRMGENLGLRSIIVYGGRLGRAENRAMVRLLKIPARSLERHRIRYLKTDRYALVDTQPGTGNNSFPHQDRRCHIVIDHHPKGKHIGADYLDIRPDTGCCTTLLLEYLRNSGDPLDPDLATAAAYAIVSETQDLEREATAADIRAYQQVLKKAKHRTLGQIRHPARSREYYRTIARAMHRVMVSKNACVCHAGLVDQPELVAELADFLIPMDRATWCLVTGFDGQGMALSIRTTHQEARAEKVMKNVLGDLGRGGGHGMIAGGRIACRSLNEYNRHAAVTTERFLHTLSRRVPEHLKPLLERE